MNQLSVSVRVRAERGRNHGTGFDIRMEREVWVAEGAWQ